MTGLSQVCRLISPMMMKCTCKTGLHVGEGEEDARGCAVM